MARNLKLIKVLLGWILFEGLGAFVFKSVEGPRENAEKERQVVDFERAGKILAKLPPAERDFLVETYRIALPDERLKWDWIGSAMFCGTVMTTIGYGNLAPKTVIGRLFVIPYGLLAISFAGCFFTITSEFVVHKLGCARDEEFDDEQDTMCHKLKRLSLALCWFFFQLAFGAFVLSHLEGWDYLSTIYFCFVTVTTIGFGDMLPMRIVSRVCNMIFILSNLGFTAYLLHSISVVLFGHASYDPNSFDRKQVPSPALAGGIKEAPSYSPVTEESSGRGGGRMREGAGG